MNQDHFREDQDFELGCASEAQNCYQEAQLELARRDQRAQAQYWTAQGKFVVVQPVQYFCRATDAFVGEYLSIRRICEDRKSADIIANAHQGDFETETYSWFVFEQSPAPAQPHQLAPEEDDECPF